MAINREAYLSEDRALVARVLAVRTIEGVSGFAVVEYHDGSVWAYPPMWYALLYGIIAQRLS